MRIKLVVALAGVLALAIASVALAVQTQTANITFSSKKAGSGTNITSVFKVGDAANQQPGQEGKATRHTGRVDIQFPKDMVFNTKAYPQCTSPSTGALKAGACKSSIIGRGSTTVDGRPGLGFLNGNLTAYNGTNRSLYILIRIKQNSALDQVLIPTLTKRNALVTKLPSILRTTKSELADFRLVINPGKGKLKIKGKTVRVPYAVLPKKCPKNGKFIIKTKYYFEEFSNGAPAGTFTTPGTINKCQK